MNEVQIVKNHPKKMRVGRTFFGLIV